tara:strand:- start:458 stop:784 length:327 start_codon:yes stop_codon:yes gene_type:complete
MNLQDIAEATAEHFGTTLKDMRGLSRQPQIVMPRKVYAFIANKWKAGNLSQIGRVILRDNTSIRDYLAHLDEDDISAEVAAIECVACIDWNAIAFTTNRNHEEPKPWT